MKASLELAKVVMEDWYAEDLIHRVNALSGLRTKHQIVSKEDPEIDPAATDDPMELLK